MLCRYFQKSIPQEEIIISMNPLTSFIKKILITHKFLHFFVTGVLGVLLNLSITWTLTTFVYGVHGYFTAYLIGTAVNLSFNFIIHTLVIFKTRTRHATRLTGFVLYNIGMTAVQASVIKYVTTLVGVQYYLLVIGGTIFTFSVGSFTVFKFFLFHEPKRA